MIRLTFRKYLSSKQYSNRFSRTLLPITSRHLHAATVPASESKNQTGTTSYPATSSQRSTDVKHLESFASEWWNSKGSFSPLHSMNMVRVPFIRDGLIATNKVNKDLIGTDRVLENVQILEVGCGGGILTENLARLHANVTGIDLSDKLIEIAREHLRNESPELANHLNYKLEPIEQHRIGNKCKYDAIIASEVIEHLDDKAQFLTYCTEALKPGGSIFVTTFNKTLLSLFGGVIMAEYVLNFIPKGTHDWNKFIPPIETQRILESCNCSVILVNGLFYESWRNTWKWIPSTAFSYAMQAIKTA